MPTTVKLVGGAPNQVPRNKDLGNLAYQNAESIAGPVGIGGPLSVVGAATFGGAVGIGGGAAAKQLLLDNFTASNSTLLRGGATNLLTYSEQFNNAAWLNNSAVISSNTAIAPDGTTTADKLVITNGVGLGTSTGAGVRQQPSKSAASITYSESIYAKAAEFNSIMLFMANGAATNGSRCSFNLANGTYSSLTSFGSGFSGASASIVPIGDGWFRCSLTTTSDTDTSIRSSVLAVDTVASQGNGTSGIYIWGAQLEQSNTSGAYLKTVETAVTTPYAAPLESPNGLALPLLPTMTPVRNSDMTFQLTSNTSLVVKVKGSDGVVRSATLTLA